MVSNFPSTNSYKVVKPLNYQLVYNSRLNDDVQNLSQPENSQQQNKFPLDDGNRMQTEDSPKETGRVTLENSQNFREGDQVSTSSAKNQSL